MSRLFLLTLLLISQFCLANPSTEAGRTLHLLSYVGVDYPNTVNAGQIVDPGEYAEQVEFAQAVEDILNTLPDNEHSSDLLAQTAVIRQAIADKLPGEDVKEMTERLTQAIVNAYDLVLVPRNLPNPKNVQHIYQQMCSACHGATGKGDGPTGAHLEPAPANFHDSERMQELSLFGLYNTITLGVQGTGMMNYSQALTEDERWSLASYVAGFNQPEPSKNLAVANFSLTELATKTPIQIAATGQDSKGFEQLRAHPSRLPEAKVSPIEFALTSLHKSWQAVENNDLGLAYQLSITAYLEGFELVEASLDNLNNPLRLSTEKAMFGYRDALRNELATPLLQQRYQLCLDKLAEVQRQLNSGTLSPAVSFSSSLVILLREGLEAILVLAAILAFLNRSGSTAAVKYVHAGWLSALVAGVGTWFVATYVIGISGANREMTEGITALVATVILLWVGIWMHSKSHAAQWQQYIKDKLSASLSSGQTWGFAILAFVAVYREIFEIILFYQALWWQAGAEGHSAIIWGVLSGFIGLIVISFAIFKVAMNIPLTKFFAVNAVIMYAMALFFVGRGIAALQETGIITSNPLAIPDVAWLGIYADGVTLAAQAFVLLIIIATLLYQKQTEKA
ncbi:cytochrome c/FTR1 family iron permease [Aliiglaciecola sp. LCG003]|uniref:cytochrome c/FTR1 family iron permease n=1 Tax=Aliiglaciecola sp. LCG003 TaxID=3053655 RepID=UPI002573B036|nr:cytochrome c/FTR1 family iron permease [Aliiglaciecola sp. LCG003]WJG10542.1 cytochrome c/FTR1 family iron permease [Aliiglaciecola sp. LCG003]